MFVIRGRYEKQMSPKKKKTIFGERLREKRLKKRLTQEELGKRVGGTRDMIINYEVKGQMPRDKTILLNLARELDTTADYLLGEETIYQEPEEIVYDLEKIKSVFDKIEFTVNGKSLPNTDQELIKSVMGPILDRILRDKKKDEH
jgi:transcriptional regulator with XRE-family HTH domain